MIPTTFDELLDRYDFFLLDAYGVLVTERGPLPGAREALERIRAAGRRWLILSNDASRLPETSVRRYRAFRLPVEREDLITSGDLIGDHLRRAGLVGKPAAVLGPEDSRRLVAAAGAVLVEPGDPAAEALIVADDDGYDFRTGIEAAMNAAAHRFERGEPLHLLLPNPDVVYPRGGPELGFTAGAVALLIEAGLRVRFGARAPRFQGLGKPHAPLFAAAMARLGEPPKERVAMVGDQLPTDVRGARDYGLDSVLVGTGLTPLEEAGADPALRPTWTLAAFSP
jgi:HAD superfamily hydrolase (TIGR01450 family)